MSLLEVRRALEAAGLFRDDFPGRKRSTHAEAALEPAVDCLPQGDAVSDPGPSQVAIDRVPHARALADLVRGLGDPRHHEAVPLLATLWSACALVPVRLAAGHALGRIGTPEARRALEALIEDADHPSVALAVRAVFDASPLEAHDRLISWFEPERMQQPGGAVVPLAVLETFAPRGFRGPKAIPEWSEPRAPQWFRKDLRWRDLCIALRRHPVLGDVARTALQHADPKLVRAGLDAAREREGPPEVRWHTEAAGDLAALYERGEHRAVWRALRGFPAISGACRAEALQVARLTMERVARNADRVAERLAAAGWVALSGSLRTRPRAKDKAVLLEIETTAGAPLPPSLRAFWEVVGGIDFVWDYERRGVCPDLGLSVRPDEMDPLSVDPPRVARDVPDRWREERDGIDPELLGPFTLDLAPDRLHKANVSGGPPYAIELPFLGADPVLLHEEHALPFVDYLRLCFRWAGFPALERYGERRDVQGFVSTMTADLEPF